MTEIEYEVREQDLYAFNEHLLQESKPMQKALRLHQVVVPGILSLLVLGLWFYLQAVIPAIILMVVAMVWAGAAPYIFLWSARRQLRSLYTEEEKVSAQGRYTLRVEPTSLVEVSPDGQSAHVNWSSVLRVEATKNYAFIFLSLNTALVVPRATIKNGDLHEFIREADERIAAAE
ncbi:MAG: YcxB family protein [Methylococcaceae bacterium]|nr:MAG: YcxB family protein [Methylococcaceae bacterium]